MVLSDTSCGKMGKCRFNDNWLEDEKYSDWLQKTKRYKMFCRHKKKNIKLGTMGCEALDTNMKGDKHKCYAENCPHSDVCDAGIYCKCKLTLCLLSCFRDYIIFTCGRDKSTYLAQFGFATYIKRELLSSVNQGSFVVMFDKSMNRYLQKYCFGS